MDEQEDKKSVYSSTNSAQEKKEIPKFVLQTCKIGNLVIDLPLVSLCAMNFFLNAACSVIAPFYPNQAKNAGLNSFETGLVIGMHPVGGFLFGLLVAKFMVRMGRRNLMCGSLIVTVITLILMGISYYMENSHGLFLATGLIARFFMGCARSGYGSTTFAYAPLLWPEKVPRVIGIMETFTGLGLMLGPLIGAGIFESISDEGWAYQGVFYILSGLFAVFIYPSIRMLPLDPPMDPNAAKKELPLGKILSRPKQLSLFLQLTGSLLTYTYILPLWANLFEYGYFQPESLSAIFMTVGTITYILSLTFIPIAIKKGVNKKVILSIGSILGVVSDLVMAPLFFFHSEKSFGWTVSGLLFAGFAQGFCILPFIPEMIELISEQFADNPELKTKVGDMASGLFMAAYSFGTFLGPFVGGLINTIYAGPKSQDIYDPQFSGMCEKFCTDHAGRYLTKKLKDGEIESGCWYLRPFQITSYWMSLIALMFFFLYISFGRGYQGWMLQFGPKKQDKLLVTNKRGEETEKAGLSDQLLTDSEFEGNMKSVHGEQKNHKKQRDSELSD